jgi:hypothetical protein
MAHFAELAENYVVLRVCVVADEHEADGENWCAGFFAGGTWIQTSYNATIRKNFAGSGYVYDSVRDAFIPPKPYQSWTLNEDTCHWQSPTPVPFDEGNYSWDEVSACWVEQ